MARSVTINSGYNDIAMPDQQVYSGPVTITLTDDQFATLSGSPLLSDGTLTDNGEVANPGDQVSVQGAHVAAPAALTSANAAGSTPTQAEFNALRADVVALRTTLAALVTSAEGSGHAVA